MFGARQRAPSGSPPGGGGRPGPGDRPAGPRRGTRVAGRAGGPGPAAIEAAFPRPARPGGTRADGWGAGRGYLNCSITVGSQVTSLGKVITMASVATCSAMNGTTPRYMCRIVISSGATARR